MTKSLSLLAVLACAGLGVEHATAASLPRTILFVDDEDVLYRAGVTRKIVPMQKFAGNPVIAPDKPWEAGSIAWTSVYRDPKTGKFQLWYQAYNQRKGDRTLENTVAYAESPDGIVWTKPNVGLFPFYEEKETNIVLVGSGGYSSRYCCSVLFDERETDPARRYKMVYYDWSIGTEEERGSGTHVAFSPDGIRWTKHGRMVLKSGYGAKGIQAPLQGERIMSEEKAANGTVRKKWAVPLSMSDAADVLYDPRHEAYVIYGKMWIPGPDGGLSWKHAMGRSQSKDFLQWSKPELVLTPNDRDPPMLEFHTSPAFFYNGQYLSLNQVLDRRAGTIDLELISSRDGFRWDRSFASVPIVARGAGAVFDAGSLFSNSTPIVVGDEIRFYFGAYRGTAIGGVGFDRQKIGSKDYFSGIGYASTRRDRFVAVLPDPASSVRNPAPQPKAGPDGKLGPGPANTIGQVTLKPIDLTGARDILLNADAAKGKIRVELLDEDGYRLRGFTKDDAVPIAADGLELRAAWKAKSLRDLPAGRYLVRVHLENAELFAVTLR
ncbi:MAG: hypothetical protein EXS32_05535 [Opitutus sp.]|nr:hypothetical protein [Opitutus sp.]